MKINCDDVNRFKKLFHGKTATTFLALGKDRQGNPRTSELHGTLQQVGGTVAKLNKQHRNIFMLVNESVNDCRSAKDIIKINALFIDYDKRDWSANDLNQFLAKFPVVPDLVVETSPGNYHLYWLVKGVPLNQFKDVQQQLATKFGSDPTVCDLPRVMRVPGTYNHKYDPPFLSRIVHAADDTKAIPFDLFVRRMFGTGASPQTDSNKKASAVSLPKSKAVVDTERVTAALKKIPSDDRSIWITVGMALNDQYGDAGLQMFKDWSMKSSKYDEPALESQWRSFKPGGGIRIGTIFWKAAESLKVSSDSGELPSLHNNFDLYKHFAATSASHLRFCEADKKPWYVFSNGLWHRSAKKAERVAIEYLTTIKVEAAQQKSTELLNFIEKYMTHSAIRDILHGAASDAALTINANAFDQTTNAIGVKLPDVPGTIERYAVLDLDKEGSRLAKAADMVLKTMGTVYDPKAQCPLWMQFLEEITVGDRDLEEFLQHAVGYTLFGHTNEQVMFILLGSGANGKGVFCRIIYRLLGDFGAIMQSALLKPGALNANSPSPALMTLNGRRMWYCSEIPKGMVIDEGLTKQLTGGDLVSARDIYAGQEEFLPVGKLWLTVNNMPRVRYDDKALWRRIIPVPFNAVFNGKKRDNTLEQRLLNELSGILNWALVGARNYADKGSLLKPRASVELLKSLKNDVDTVGMWINNRCVKGGGATIQAKPAFDDYCDAMKQETVTRLSQKEFKADLERRGFEHCTGNKFNYYCGLKFKSN